MDTSVEFRGRRLKLWPETEEPLGKRAEPEVFLRRESDMQMNGYTVPLSLSEPMRDGAEDFDKPWSGPFCMPGLRLLEAHWFHSDGSLMLLQTVASVVQFRMPLQSERVRALPFGITVRRKSLVRVTADESMQIETPEFYRKVDLNPMTEDGHVWFAAITSSVGGGKGLVTILFPRLSQDRQKLLRPMAMYTIGDVTDYVCAKIVSSSLLRFEVEKRNQGPRAA